MKLRRMTMLIIVSILMAVLPPPGSVIAAQTQEQEQEESQFQVQDQKVLSEFGEGLQLNYLALTDSSSGDDAEKDSSFKVQVQDPETLWDLGAGFRFNYLRLSGGFSGYDAEKNHSFDINYKDIGMDNYSPSVALALAGKYKKWNLFFGASRGSYSGSFVTDTDIIHDGETIPAGSKVDGKIDMGIYSLSTTYALVKKQHDLGVGLGILLLDMGMEFETNDIRIGDSNIFPMPFLALSGRLKFDRFRISGVGGGAYFHGKMDGMDYTVYYYTADIKGTYELLKKNNWSTLVSLGYRVLYMDSKASKDGSWFKEEDMYHGPFFSVIVRFSKFADLYR